MADTFSVAGAFHISGLQLAQTDTPAAPQIPAAPQPPAVPEAAPPAAAPAPDIPDPTAVTQPWDTIWTGLSRFVELGGPVVALLLLLSVFALAIILIKLWQLAALRRGGRAKIDAAIKLWLARDHDAALDAARDANGPLAGVVGHTMAATLQRRDEAHVREETEQRAGVVLADLRSYLRALEAVAQVAPLLGLFGTVIGMIEAFRALQAAGTQVNPADLAGGIWVALLTTAVGLAIAMPVSLVLHWLEGRIERVRRLLEGWVTQVLTNPPARGARAGGDKRQSSARPQALEHGDAA